MIEGGLIIEFGRSSFVIGSGGYANEVHIRVLVVCWL